MITKDYFVSDAKYVELDFNIDYQAMLNEAKSVKEYFITHRPDSTDHKGWKSLVLHGWSEDQTGHWKSYGYKNIEEVIENLKWTEISKKCPTIVNFIKNEFPCNLFGRVRLMLVEGGGYIAEHVDSSVPILENTNISLSNPKDCYWRWGDGETVFMTPGKTYLMNIHYPHSVQNNSNEDRFHLIIHRLDCTDKWKNKLLEACEQQKITGKFVNHEVLI